MVDYNPMGVVPVTITVLVVPDCGQMLQGELIHHEGSPDCGHLWPTGHHCGGRGGRGVRSIPSVYLSIYLSVCLPLPLSGSIVLVTFFSMFLLPMTFSVFCNVLSKGVCRKFYIEKN